MDFRYQCANFKSMPMYIYDYWYDKQYTNTLTISYLFSLSYFMQILAMNEVTYIAYEIIWT